MSIDLIPDYQPQDLAYDIFKKRYALHDQETWGEACERVGGYVATAENGENVGTYRNKFSQILKKNLFMPGGRIWYGSGRPKGQLLNCFVIPTADSREGWGKTTSDMIIITGTGGGLGVNFSPIRPRGTGIAGSGGIATGATSLMEILNSAGEVIKAGGGRRVAMMHALGLSHGDVEEFLDKKLDLGKLNNANVSVVFDENPEEFFRKVKQDEMFDLVFRSKVIGQIPARKLWKKIISNALKGGEPGLLNGYLANRMNNIWYFKPLICTNPCQPAWATVLTPGGLSTIGAIKIGDTIWSGKQWTKVVNKTMTGVKPVKAFRTRAGTFYGTDNHRVVSNGIKIEAKDAESIDTCLGPGLAKNIVHDPKFVMDGLVFGDGMTHKASNLTVLLIGKNDSCYFNSEVKHLIGEARPGIKETAWEIQTSLHNLTKTYDRTVPEKYTENLVSTCSFLRGLYSANGSIVANRVTLKAASFNVIEKVQELLAALGIRSYYTVNKAHETEFENGTYICKENYDLNIGTLGSRHIFKELIGFVHPDKQAKLNDTLKTITATKDTKTNYDIVDVECLGEEKVYDITVEAEEHTYWTGGMLVSNCGEIWLVENDCCDLGAVVLPRFVRDGVIDFTLMGDVVADAVRFLDNVLTVNNYPLMEIKEMCSLIRRIGLGVMGIHDMLLLIGLKYNSDKGLEVVDKVMNFIKNKAYETSIELAKEKGSFPKFDAELFLKSGFAKTLKPSIRSKIREFGIRNCALLTIAPTGTTSMVSAVTSGIEPMFAPAYQRKYRDGDDLKTEIVIHPLLASFIEDGKSVKHFQGAFDLKLRDHFEMQRVCQRHLDNACSKTINLPAGTLEDELSDLYMEFFPDLKGVTVYPDGSREDQPLTPMSLNDAIAHAKEARAQAAEGRCKAGVCEI